MMAQTLSPDILMSSIESLGIEAPSSFETDELGINELHSGFVSQFDRLAQISEKPPTKSLYHRIHGPTNNPDIPRRTGEVHKVIENNGVALRISNVNGFSDESGDFSDYASWTHYRRTEMGLSIPIDRGLAVVSLRDVSSSTDTGATGIDFDGVEGYTDDEDSPKLSAGWKASVSETASIEADFSSLMRVIGISHRGEPEKKERELKLEAEGKFTGVDLKRAFSMGIAIMEKIEPSILKAVKT